MGSLGHMNPFSSSQFDPSQMDPKMLMELSRVVQQLPPEQLNRMQTLMHNMMAGHDVTREMAEFERSLPPGFREKLTAMMGAPGAFSAASPAASAEITPPTETIAGTPEVIPTSGRSEEMDLHLARITILRAVADGRMTPEEAEKLLFV
jgi:hypothetical protein